MPMLSPLSVREDGRSSCRGVYRPDCLLETSMRRSKSEIYLHFIWATYHRSSWITPNLEARLYACIQAECSKLDCEVLAIGGMPDHVHLAVKAPTKVSPARLTQHVKGISSAVMREVVDRNEGFGWQDNYAVFSFSRSHKNRVIAYIKGQKHHHSSGTVWPEWEEADEVAS